MNTEKNIELLDRYLMGATSEKEKKEVETRLGTDLDFKNSYQEHKATMEGIRQFRREQLKGTLKEALRTPSAKKGKIISLRRLNWRVAAAAIVLIVAGTFFYQSQNFYQNLYAEFEPDRVEAVEAGGTDDEQGSLGNLLSFKAYVKGVQLSKNGQTSAGIDTLSLIPAQVELYYFWAQYEIALVHLLNEDQEAAKAQLEKVVNMEGDHIAKEKAVELLKKLEQPKWMPF